MKKRILVALAILPLFGCSTTSTISRLNAPAIDGKIVGADAQNIYVRSQGGAQAVAKTEVTDIDHPGDTATVFGAILTGYGALNIAVGAPKCSAEGAAFCTGVFLPLAVGAPLLVWGIVTHASSVGALGEAPPSDTKPQAAVVPILPIGDSHVTGASLSVSF